MQLGAYRGMDGETVTLLKEIVFRRLGAGGSMIAIFMEYGKEIAMEESDFQFYFKKIDDHPIEEDKEIPHHERTMDLLTDIRDLLNEIRNDVAQINYNTLNTR